MCARSTKRSDTSARRVDGYNAWRQRIGRPPGKRGREITPPRRPLRKLSSPDKEEIAELKMKYKLLSQQLLQQC